MYVPSSLIYNAGIGKTGEGCEPAVTSTAPSPVSQEVNDTVTSPCHSRWVTQWPPNQYI